MLLLASKDYKKQYLNFIEECREDVLKTGFTSSIPISGNASFERDIQQLIDRHNGQNLPEGWVPDSTFWLYDRAADKILGVIIIRPRINEFLRFRGGHIAYYVRPSERNKGYASKMLALGLQYCKEIGLDRVLITCSKDNIYSAKTIIYNGGILDSEDTDHGQVFQRYWINL